MAAEVENLGLKMSILLSNLNGVLVHARNITIRVYWRQLLGLGFEPCLIQNVTQNVLWWDIIAVQ